MRTLLAALLMMSATLIPVAGEPGAPESRLAPLDGFKVHYTNYGEGPFAVVFVHGWSCDETVWNGVAPALPKQNVRAITVDLPGHGKSDKPQIVYNMDLYARALDAVLQHAKVDKAVLVGHSNGTPAIRQFYRRHPAAVSALVIVDGKLRPFVDAAVMEKFIAPLRGADYARTAGALIDSMTQPIGDEAMRERIRTMMLRTPQFVAVSEFESTADPELWQLDPIDVPVLMILAKSPMWNTEYEQFARALAPQLDYVVWENVSHFLMMEKPREFNDALLAFMRKHLLLPERC
ncbi:MAG TPA: alpha/beta hydrolase [Chthoniobacterales bacterium]|nr:alpha/beta hydrolase [Chthoniobacterales bacterium]